MKISKKLLLLLITGTISLSNVKELETGELKEVKIEETGEKNNTNNLEQSQTVEYEITNVVTALTNVNLRDDADIQGIKLGVLKKGDSLEYIYKVGDWYEVLYNNATSYVSAKYVEEGTKTKIKSDYKKIAYVNELTQLYKEKNNLEPISDIEQFEIVKVYDETDDYYLTQIDDNIGYVNKYFTEDLTGTFVTVDISDQELNLYEDGKVILTSPVITGKVVNGNSLTPVGIYEIYDMLGHRDLVGEDYREHVDYMMKFNGNIGLHDAEYHTCLDRKGKVIHHGWRDTKSFGGSTYIYHGSHGCVNMPHDAAQFVNDNINIKDKVLVKK